MLFKTSEPMYMQCALIKPYSFQIFILGKNESSLLKTRLFKKSYLKLKTLASGLWNNHGNTPSRTSLTKSLFAKSRTLRNNNNMTWIINNLVDSTHPLCFFFLHENKFSVGNVSIFKFISW